MLCPTPRIGFLHGEAGICVMLHELTVFATGSVQQILLGKDFGFYALKVVEEALISQLMVNFTKWCEKNGYAITERMCDITQELDQCCIDKKAPSDTFARLCNAVETLLTPLLSRF